jgi:lipoprotein NlpD
MTGSPHVGAFLPVIPHRKLIGFLLVAVLLLSCSGCSVRGSRARGVYHRVKTGETLSIIARAYHTNVQELAEVNNIRTPDEIAVGSVVFIPDASQVVDDVLTESRVQGDAEGTRVGGAPAGETKTAPPAGVSRKAPPKKPTAAEGGKRGERASAEAAANDRAALSRAAERDMASRRAAEKAPVGEAVDRPAKKREENGGTGEIQFDRKRFIWPVSGKVVAKFGTESITTDFNGRKVETAKIMNNGIKIAAAAGTPVIAAGAGKVVYSMTLERFGNTIIIEHDDEYKTVYYDLGKRLVETLQKVKKGEPIGYLGDTRAAKSEAYMNFEIRHRNKPRNPLFFLP